MGKRGHKADPAAGALAGRIKAIMQARGMTQTTLAIRAGIERTNLNRFLNGHRAMSLDELAWIAEALGTAIEDLAAEAALPEDMRGPLVSLGETLQRLRQTEAERDDARNRISDLESLLAREREQWLARYASLEQRLDRLELLLGHRSSADDTGAQELSNVQRHGALAAAIMTMGLLSGSIVLSGRN
ncbi:MAG: hypothetical protein A2V77_07990 [Anaeromyxobacter sp. RBG_16_69_14]|nr:MAG: hypothetical protein A2V77_07990 [Anaeromyxobacter sp. RBG_16_69_14]